MLGGEDAGGAPGPVAYHDARDALNPDKVRVSRYFS